MFFINLSCTFAPRPAPTSVSRAYTPPLARVEYKIYHAQRRYIFFYNSIYCCDVVVDTSRHIKSLVLLQVDIQYFQIMYGLFSFRRQNKLQANYRENRREKDGHKKTRKPKEGVGCTFHLYRVNLGSRFLLLQAVCRSNRHFPCRSGRGHRGLVSAIGPCCSWWSTSSGQPCPRLQPLSAAVQELIYTWYILCLY